LRWVSLPPNPCPGQLPDPRFDPDPEVKFCEEMTYADLQAEGALIINGSMVMDAPLHRWKNLATNDVVTTMRGFYSGLPGESIEPFVGYDEYLGADGMIMRNLTGTLDAKTDMIELYLQHEKNTGDLTVSDGVALPAHTFTPNAASGVRSADFEGYAFKDPKRIGNLTTLRVCPVGTDYNTTIGSGCTSSLAQPMYALPAP
jgi:hypothetical protein